jgi:cold shock CspA family protein
MRFTGKLKTWTDDKGFGFITPTEGGQDIFVHISEYPRGQIPALNEMLSFEVALNPQGKKKAVKVHLAAGLSASTRQDSSRDGRQGSSRQTLSRKPSASGLLRRIAMLALIALVGWAGYQHYVGRWPSFGKGTPSQRVGDLSRPQAPAASRFSCDGRTHCSQMTSCEEATFFLRNCPGTQMDGDGDGMPCEQQWCK